MPSTALSEGLAGVVSANTWVVLAAATLVLWVSRRSDRGQHPEFMRLWSASWLSFILARATSLLLVGSLSDGFSALAVMLLSGLAQTAFLMHAVLLLFCVMGRVGRPPGAVSGRGWLAIAGVVFVVSLGVSAATLDSTMETRLFLRVGLRYLLMALAFGCGGVALIRHGMRIDRTGARFSGLALLMGATSYALHAWFFAGLEGLTVTGWGAYLGALDVLAICAIGFGMVLWSHEDVNQEAAHINRELGERTTALLQAQRLESIGQLASGIAHDFNNVLTVVVGNTEALLRLDSLAPEVRVGLEETRQATMHAAKMTNQLLSLASDQATALRTIDVVHEARGILPLLRCLAGARIEVDLQAPHVPLRVDLRRGHVEQILINLVTNGRDAITDDGHIVIKVWREESGGGARVLLSARDSGQGMSDGVRERIGELFFTTKGGRGTGLGMASVRSILSATDGRLHISTQTGTGTEVIVSWSEAESEALSEAGVECEAVEPAVLVPRPAGATVLFAEDDPMVRTVTRRTLENAGYRVLLPEDARAAATVAREHPGKIDLLLTDVVMPGLSGPQLASEVQQVRPGTPVRFISGYIDDEHGAQLSDDTPVLTKPFTREELLEFVQAALAAGDANTSAQEVGGD